VSHNPKDSTTVVSKASTPWSISCRVATAVKSLVTEAVSKRVVKRFGVFQERLA
jgi:hypothetical protein